MKLTADISHSSFLLDSSSKAKTFRINLGNSYLFLKSFEI